jgi:hypothetical protein
LDNKGCEKSRELCFNSISRDPILQNIIAKEGRVGNGPAFFFFQSIRSLAKSWTVNLNAAKITSKRFPLTPPSPPNPGERERARGREKRKGLNVILYLLP